jgi:hypothetical protein
MKEIKCKKCYQVIRLFDRKGWLYLRCRCQEEHLEIERNALEDEWQ